MARTIHIRAEVETEDVHSGISTLTRMIEDLTTSATWKVLEEGTGLHANSITIWVEPEPETGG